MASALQVILLKQASKYLMEKFTPAFDDKYTSYGVAYYAVLSLLTLRVCADKIKEKTDFLRALTECSYNFIINNNAFYLNMAIDSPLAKKGLICGQGVDNDKYGKIELTPEVLDRNWGLNNNYKEALDRLVEYFKEQDGRKSLDFLFQDIRYRVGGGIANMKKDLNTTEYLRTIIEKNSPCIADKKFRDLLIFECLDLTEINKNVFSELFVDENSQNLIIKF